MIGPLGLVRVPHADGAWPEPAGYLHGQVDTRVAGYRTVTVDTVPVVVPAGVYLGDELAALDVFASTLSGVVSLGQTLVTVPGVQVEWTDRLGELLGFGRAPGESETPDGEDSWARTVSPLWVPYAGAKMLEVEVRRESHLAVSRLGRAVQRTWGVVRLRRWEVTLWAWAAPALVWLRAGGRVAVAPVGGTRVEGVVVDLSPWTWTGRHREFARVTLTVAEEV